MIKRADWLRIAASVAAGMVIGLYAAVWGPVSLGRFVGVDAIHSDPYVWLMLVLLVAFPLGGGIVLGRLASMGAYPGVLRLARWLALIGVCYEVFRLAT